VQLAPGLTFGDGRRTFFVRGFPSGAQYGSSATGWNVEYRFPLALPAAGFWKTPLYFQRLSAALFTDAAAAWCPSGSSASPICPRATPREMMSSVGAELHLDAAFQYDSPYRIRFGVATPTSGKKYFGASKLSSYVTVGLPF
jgi:hemolysin activation/secretion protein